MDLREKDVKARVVKFFMKCDEIILQNGLQSTFSTTTGAKEKCKILKRCLEPAALRQAVDSHQRLVDSASKSDEQQLYFLVKEKALEQEKIFQLLNKRKQQSGDAGQRVNRDHGKRQRYGNNRANPGQSARGETSRPRVVTNAKPAPAVPASKPRTGCFHCQKDHWLSQCPDLDEAGKEALLAERKAKKTGNNAGKNPRIKRVEPATIDDKIDRPTVIINGVFELPYCADSGSDFNILSRRHADELCQVDKTARIMELSDPVESRAVGGALITSTHAIEANLTLNTAAGPVRCQDLKRCLIVEADEDEFLVGKILLAELGIDVDRQLEYLAAREDDDSTFDDPTGMPSPKPVVADVVLNVVNSLVSDAVDRG
ncbi:hypothetical protein F442_13115, partial [Phytophthora nicotianae P10297]